MRYLPLLLIFVTSLCFADVERKNITVDENFKATGERYFMCNFFCKTPKTILSKVKNCRFEKCNLYDCEVDESNIIAQSNTYDRTKPPKLSGDEKRIKQLEDYIKANRLPVPTEVIDE